MHNSFLSQNIAQAASLLEKGNIDRAISVFNVLSSKFPKNAEVFHLKAYAYLQSQNLDKAKENFEKAISISPEDCNIVLDYSNFLNSIGKKRLSLQQISNLTRNNKADYRLFYLQGCIQMDLKNYEDSIKSFKNVLQMKPDHKDASFNLGVIHFETKKYDLAEKIFDTYLKSFGKDVEAHRYLLQIFLITNQINKADALSSMLCVNNPNEAFLFYERARVLTRLFKNKEAISYYEKCLKISADFNDAFKNMAILLKKENLINDYIKKISDKSDSNYTNETNIAQCYFINGEASKALDHIEKALSLHPKSKTKDKDYINTKTIKGSILSALEKYNESNKIYNEIINLDNSIVQAYVCIGDNLRKLNKKKEAIEYYKKGILVNPSCALAYQNLGDVYCKLGDKEKALEYLNQSYSIDPNNSLILSSKAAIHIELEEPLLAIDLLKKAIKIDPFNGNAFYNLGIILKNQNLYDQAIKMFEQSINAYKKSSYKNISIAKAYSSIGLCYLSLNKFEKMKEYFLKVIEYDEEQELALGFIYYAKLYCGEWNNLAYYKNLTLKKIKENKLPTTPFTAFSITDDPKIQYQATRKFSESINNIKTINTQFSVNKKHLKPRIAYLSYDFHDHATMHLMAGIFENQNHDKFDYYAFSYSDRYKEHSEAKIYNRVKDSFNKIHLVDKKSNEEISNMLREREVDIVVDLKGHTYKTRMNILSKKPCPIQITYLGHPGTSGVDYIDYVIADNFIVTADNEKYFSEKVIKLPSCYQPTDNKRYMPKKQLTKKELGLPENKFIFCSFNSPYKIQKETFDVWIEILKSNNDSILWLLENENSESKNNILTYAKENGIDPSRIIYSKRCEMNDYLDKLTAADLFLDTFPVNAHTTASDALWVGLPIITMSGKSLVSRVAGSLLNSISVQELITYNYTDYKNLAIKLSTDREFYNKIKLKINNNKKTKPLFNTKKFTKNLENIYWDLFTNFKNKNRV